MSDKERVSITVDADVAQVGRQAVADGAAPSFSAWVNEALRREATRLRRLAAMDEAIAAFEAEHGVITDEEVEATKRWARENAVVVRGKARSGAA